MRARLKQSQSRGPTESLPLASASAGPALNGSGRLGRGRSRNRPRQSIARIQGDGDLAAPRKTANAEASRPPTWDDAGSTLPSGKGDLSHLSRIGMRNGRKRSPPATSGRTGGLGRIEPLRAADTLLLSRRGRTVAAIRNPPGQSPSTRPFANILIPRS